MKILNKMKKINNKRVYIMISAILLSICVYTSSISTRNQPRSIGDAVQVTALPVSGKTVILDARTWDTR